MWDSLTVASPWVSVGRGCAMTHRVCVDDEVEFVFGANGRTFELGFDGDALRHFLTVATAAVADLDHQAARRAVNHP